jgi:hypothetical protein
MRKVTFENHGNGSHLWSVAENLSAQQQLHHVSWLIWQKLEPEEGATQHGTH